MFESGEEVFLFDESHAEKILLEVVEVRVGQLVRGACGRIETEIVREQAQVAVKLSLLLVLVGKFLYKYRELLRRKFIVLLLPGRKKREEQSLFFAAMLVETFFNLVYQLPYFLQLVVFRLHFACCFELHNCQSEGLLLSRLIFFYHQRHQLARRQHFVFAGFIAFHDVMILDQNYPCISGNCMTPLRHPREVRQPGFLYLRLMRLLTDDVEIFSWLEEAGADRFDPTRPSVLEIPNGNCCGVLVFNPHGVRKGCKLFLLDRYQLTAEARLLLNELLLLPDDEDFAKLKNDALLLCEQLLSRRDNEMFFFDAH